MLFSSLPRVLVKDFYFFLSFFSTALSVKPEKTMELFLYFISTVALSLFLAFLVAKIFSGFSSSSSSSTCSDDHEGSVVVVGVRNFEAKSEKHGFEGEGGTGFGFVKEIVEDGDLGESRKERFVLEETLNENDAEIDENEGLREVGVVGLVVEKIIEEKMVVQSIEGEKNVYFEMGLFKDGILERENETEEDNDGINGVFGCEEISVESGNIAKNGTECCEDEVDVAKRREIEILECGFDNEIGDGNKNGEEVVKEVSFDEDDDWEGVERTELERLFGAAVAYVGSKSNAERISSLGSNVMNQLYGLYKIANEGPCHIPQPMALKVSARAKWNAWKQLGNMAPEAAMEQYVTILLGSIQDDIVGDKQNFGDAGAYSKLASDLKTWQKNQQGAVDERKPACNSMPSVLHEQSDISRNLSVQLSRCGSRFKDCEH